jgi:uncharacterized protein (DUF1697 family)
MHRFRPANGAPELHRVRIVIPSPVMPRLVALLRGINVGGHRVRMDALRRHFEDLGFEKVETYIASGNVLFDAPRRTTAASLERKIEGHLQAKLDYAVPTLIRSAREIDEIVSRQPFDDIAPDHSLYVIMHRSPPDAAHRRQLAAWCSDTDDFVVRGREVYWRCRGKITEVSKAWPLMQKSRADSGTTSRNISTMRRLNEILNEAR